MIGIVEIVTGVSAVIAMAYFYVEFERPDIKRNIKNKVLSAVTRRPPGSK
jgi:hypothetical protein